MQKTCFVIMGFQTKKIPNTNISIDLDATYKYLIKPVLIEKNLISVYSGEIHRHAFRCDEVYTTQAINATFIRNLYLADIVVADITTLNQNAIYELGMRHAMKPKSTIIMCDKKTLEYNKFFDLTFNPQIIYDSDKQRDIEEIQRISQQLANVIETCKNADDTYIDSPVFSMRVYEEKLPLNHSSNTEVEVTLSAELERANQFLENEQYNEAETTFARIINEYSYISDDVICSYVLSSYKKEYSVQNLEQALHKMRTYISLDNTTCENALGIVASIHLKLFDLTNDATYLYAAIEYYRKGSNYESGNIYCAKNYCSSLLKIYLVEDNLEILKEYYYTAKHNAKVFLTQAQTIKRKSDLYNNAWFMSNQSDLLLISSNIENSPFCFPLITKRQKTTITEGRKDLINDLMLLKKKIIGE